MQHRQIGSHRKTSPVRSLRAPARPNRLPGSGEASLSFHQPRHTWARGASRKPSLGSLHRASFLRQAQVLAEKTPLRQLAVEEGTSQTKILAEPSFPKRRALEGRASQRIPEHPPTRHRQLDLEKLEHTMLEIERLQKVVKKLVRDKLPPTLAAELADNECKKESDSDSDSDSSNNNNNNNNNKQQQNRQQ